MSGAIAAADSRLAGLTATASPVRSVLNRDGERLLVPLFGAVGLLFLIACANVSGLLVARGLQRQQEYATRAAHRRRARPALPAGADRERSPSPSARRARRRPRLRHRRRAQEHRRPGRAAGRRRHASAGRCCSSACWPRSRPAIVAGAAAGHPRLVGRSLRAAQGIADDGGPGRTPSAGRRRRACRSCSRSRCWPAPRCSCAPPATSIASTRATRPSTSWR